MRKIAVLLVLVCMLLVMGVNAGFAMSQKALDEKRQEMTDSLATAPSVSFNDLCNNEAAYKSKIVKFSAILVGTDDPSAMLEDGYGNHFLISYITTYKLKLNESYEISATFKGISTTSDGEKFAVFTYEKAHMPFMSEYGF
jgi:hypothetical protein